ncbi:MAG TPA: STAS domain-containing protein [Solirubrobacteraceae bacterium]|nr:STAS domain-containing protein [Solirubrobacteraceae bacterium]
MALLARSHSAPAPVWREGLGEHACIVEVRGVLSWGTAAELLEAVDAARREGRTEFVLDLSAVTGVDSLATMTLRALPERLELCDVVVAAEAQDAVVAIAQAAIHDDWPLRPTRAEALALLLSRPILAG